MQNAFGNFVVPFRSKWQLPSLRFFIFLDKFNFLIKFMNFFAAHSCRQESFEWFDFNNNVYNRLLEAIEWLLCRIRLLFVVWMIPFDGLQWLHAKYMAFHQTQQTYFALIFSPSFSLSRLLYKCYCAVPAMYCDSNLSIPVEQ